MGAYKKLYDDVFNKLSTLTDINSVLDYNGQYLEEEQAKYNVIKYPAVFVESVGTSWDKNKNKFLEVGLEPQTGLATIKIHIVHKTLKAKIKETRQEFYNIIDKVVTSLQKMQCGNNDTGTYTTLMRVSEEQILPSTLYVTVITFETQLTDIFEFDESKYVEKIISITVIPEFDINPFDALQDVSGEFILDANNEFIYTKENY